MFNLKCIQTGMPIAGSSSPSDSSATHRPQRLSLFHGLVLAVSYQFYRQ